MSLGSALKLIAITDLERFGEKRTLAAWRRLAAAARPGSVAVDLRDRSRDGRHLLELGEHLGAIAGETGQALIVNDRLDLALLLGSDALHLGEQGIPSARARQHFRGAIVRACHAPETVVTTDADIVLLSPILEPRKGRPSLGLGALRASQSGTSRRPRLFALGGIDAPRAASCIAAGADGVAAIAAVFGAEEPAPLLAALGILR
jgi:thiamine-phosphate pyrophosphorylase